MWIRIEDLWLPCLSFDAAMADFQMKDETTPTREGGRAPCLVASAFRSAMAEPSNTSLFVAHLPCLNKDPYITMDESFSHKSFVGKREGALKSAYTASSDPQATPVHPFRKSACCCSIKDSMGNAQSNVNPTATKNVHLNICHMSSCTGLIERGFTGKKPMYQVDVRMV